MDNVSVRSTFLRKRTYCRPVEGENRLETWDEVCDRVIRHQRNLWETAKGAKLSDAECRELEFLREIQYNRLGSLAGRTLWLGGTDIARTRASSNFNCAFLEIENVHDVVDAFWLLLQGCGVGFSMRNGNLTGFRKRIKSINIIRSLNKEKGDLEGNEETYDEATKTWTIKLGDSAMAWAKAIGKLLVGKYPAHTLVLDFSEVRKAGQRLKGYGWICSGDAQIAAAFEAIANLLNNRAGSALTKIDLLDILNWLGSTLSSRRSAQIALLEYGDKEWENFATAKKDWWVNNPQREQSNNSIVFNSKPSKLELEYIFDLMIKSGGSEPGFINMEAARSRAPYAKGVNPCAEILLTNGGFCNLVEHNLNATGGDMSLMRKVQYYLARANYRQTCVDLRDGILQEKWHTNNDFYRLCGVGLTGIVQANLEDWQYKELMRIAVHGAYSMADELDLPRPKNVTCIKPSGSLSKIMDCSEGLHKPLGRYVFNNINFSKYDPLVTLLGRSGYRVKDHPSNPSSVLITLPVEYEGVKFEDFHGTPVNFEPAINQLERYKMLMRQYVDQNASTTIYYAPEEVPAIIDWLLSNWDTYVGVSFLFRTDPTKTAADLGYLYLPQEVVDEKTFNDYVKNLKPVDLEDNVVFHETDEIPEDAECTTGACPIR